MALARDVERRRFPQAHAAFINCAIACVIVIVLPVRLAGAAAFDWRDVNGLDFTTPVRDQGQCSSCWVFGAIAAVESKLEITLNDPNLDPDLSEQFVISLGNAGDCSGGFEYKALQFLKNVGTLAEEELPYMATDDVPPEMLEFEEGWQNRLYKIEEYESFLTATTDNLKWAMRTYGPLVGFFVVDDDWYAPGGAALEYPAGGDNHVALVVGYQDDEAVEGGGYWIIKNSWGTSWGDNGYGYVRYGVLESYDRIHAITGDAYQTPEPTVLLLLGSAGGLLSCRRRRRTIAPR